MDPIEIELRMKQNLQEEASKAKGGLDGLSSAAERSRQEVRQNIAIQKRVLQELRRELKPLEGEFKKVNFATHDPGVVAERKRLSATIKQMTSEIKGEEQALAQLEKQLESTGQKSSSLLTQQRNLRIAMAELKRAGKEQTSEFKELQEELGTLGTAYREISALEKSLTKGGANLSGFLDGLNILSGTLSSGAGALALFNGDSEKMAEIQTKVQGVMAISIGLMQVSNALHSSSAFRVVTVTKAQQLWAAANLRVATTLGITTAAANVLMGALTLGLSVAITAIVAGLSKFISKQREAAKAAKEYNQSVAEGSASQITAYEKLRKEYESFNGKMAEQMKLVVDNQDEFKKLGVAIDDVNEAERFFSDEGAEAFKQGILDRAKSIALMEKAAEKYKGIIEKELALEDGTGTKTSVWQDFIASVASQGALDQRATQRQFQQSFADKNTKDLEEELKQDKAEWSKMLDRANDYSQSSAANFKKAGIDTTDAIVDFTKAYWESQRKNAQEAMSGMKDSEIGSSGWVKELNKYREAVAKLKLWDFDTNESKNKVTDDKERAALAKQYKEVEAAAAKARIAAMQDGIEKTLAENELNHQSRLEQIERQKEELLKAMLELEEATWRAQGGTGKFRSTITDLPAELNEAFMLQTQASIEQLQDANREAINKLIGSVKVDSKDTSAVLGSIANVQQEKLKAVAAYERLQLKALSEEAQKLDAETYEKRKDLIAKNAEDARIAISEEAEEALKLVPKDMLNELFGQFDLSFMNLNAATLGQLNKVADKLQKLKLDKSQLITLGLSESQILMLQSLLEDIKEEGAGNIQTARLGKMQEAFSEIGSLMAIAGDEMTRAVGQMVSSLGQMITTLNDPNASGFQKASGIISLAITAGNELAKLRDGWMNEEVEKQMELNKSLAYQLTLEAEINRMRRERAETERNSSAFLNPDFKVEYKAQLKDMKDAEKTLDSALGSLMGNAVFTGEGQAKRRLFGTKKGSYSFSMNEVLGSYARQYGGDGASDLLPLLTGTVGGLGSKIYNKGGSGRSVLGALLDPAGLFGGYASSKAKNNAFDKIQVAFNETLKAMGKTSSDVAKMSSQEWVDFYTLMEEGGHITDQATKEMIQTAKTAAEEHAQAMQKMRDIIADVAGSLGTQLTSDLVSAFKAGEDAAEAFKKSVNAVLQQMFMQEIETAFFRKHFDKLQKEMNKSIDGGDEDWEDDLMEFFNAIEPAIGKAEKAMEVWDKKMADAGYDGFKGGDEDSRSAKSKGLAQASQDSIDELNGRILAISGNVYKIYEGNNQMLNLEREALLVARTITAQLDVIAYNTSYCKYLVDIDSTLEEIKTKGVKLR